MATAFYLSRQSSKKQSIRLKVRPNTISSSAFGIRPGQCTQTRNATCYIIPLDLLYLWRSNTAQRGIMNSMCMDAWMDRCHEMSRQQTAEPRCSMFSSGLYVDRNVYLVIFSQTVCNHHFQTQTLHNLITFHSSK